MIKWTTLNALRTFPFLSGTTKAAEKLGVQLGPSFRVRSTSGDIAAAAGEDTTTAALDISALGDHKGAAAGAKAQVSNLKVGRAGGGRMYGI